MNWRLIVPAENWQNPLPLPEEQIPLLETIAERLGLRAHRDPEQQKFYLGLPSKKIPWHQRKVKLSEAAAAPYRTTGIYRAAPLLEIDPKEPLSENFRAGEFFPNDPQCKYLRISPELIEALERLRQKIGGAAITIHSAYRPPAYNAAIGGVSNSAHIDGLAADISADGVSTSQLYRAADEIIGARGGVGYYPRAEFVHIDVRGHHARWTG